MQAKSLKQFINARDDKLKTRKTIFFFNIELLSVEQKKF